MERVDELARVALGGDLRDLDLGVIEEEAQQLAAGVARGADDGDGRLMGGGAHSGASPRAVARAKSTILPGMLTPVGSMEFRYSIV